MKKWMVFLCCLALFACALNSAVPYVPNPNVSAPEKVIERIMISQPPDYAGAVPFKVSVINRPKIVLTEIDPLSLILSPSPGGEGRVRGGCVHTNMQPLIREKEGPASSRAGGYGTCSALGSAPGGVFPHTPDC